MIKKQWFLSIQEFVSIDARTNCNSHFARMVLIRNCIRNFLSHCLMLPMKKRPFPFIANAASASTDAKYALAMTPWQDDRCYAMVWSTWSGQVSPFFLQPCRHPLFLHTLNYFQWEHDYGCNVGTILDLSAIVWIVIPCDVHQQAIINVAPTNSIPLDDCLLGLKIATRNKHSLLVLVEVGNEVINQHPTRWHWTCCKTSPSCTGWWMVVTLTWLCCPPKDVGYHCKSWLLSKLKYPNVHNYQMHTWIDHMQFFAPMIWHSVFPKWGHSSLYGKFCTRGSFCWFFICTQFPNAFGLVTKPFPRCSWWSLIEVGDSLNFGGFAHLPNAFGGIHTIPECIKYLVLQHSVAVAVRHRLSPIIKFHCQQT